MLTRACAILLFGLTLVPGPSALARPPVRATATPVPASPDSMRLYVFSLNDTPVAEAAQDIVGGALSYELTIDPAVEGVVSFRAEGWSSGEALLNEFGSALLDEDIALMRIGVGAYVLIPRVNVPMMLARGGVLMTLPEPGFATPPSPAATAGPSVVYGRDRWWDSAFAALLVFFAGVLAGGAALFGGQTVYRSAEARTRLAAPPLRLTDQRLPSDWPPDAAAADPDLVIPRFDAGSRAPSRPRSPRI